MTTEVWVRIEHHFERIAELQPLEKQAALDLLANTDADIFEEVASLLAEDEVPHPLLSAQLKQAKEVPMEGREIGAYRLVKLLGEGGMGRVFLAERKKGDFHQQVALKLVRIAAGDSDMERHFTEERQILARLRHNHIAALYDGGMSEDGQPYFTMEFVEGKPLVEYCRDANFGLRERLRLFLQVCEAVSYAHRQLIAHLDIKPGNTLVNREGNVKLLDFGLARVVEQEDPSPAPRYTPAYAAPEQLEGISLSTSSDIYSLGVMLYELLCRELPHRPTGGSLKAWKEAIRKKPVAPGKRANPVRGLSLLASTELDDICMHALAYKAEDRYESVQDLAADLEAVLEDRPISLRTGSGLYWARKYLKRNRAIFTLIAVSLAALIGLIGFYTWQLRAERNLARKEATKSGQLVELMKSVFVNADPLENQGENMTARELLDQALTGLSENKLADQPALKAEMLRIMSGTYAGLNLYEQADSLALQALRQQQALGEEDPDALALSWIQLGDVKQALGQFPAADSCLQIGAEILRSRYGESDSLYVRQLEFMANNYYSWNKYDKADSLYHLVYNYFVQWYQPPDKRLANLLHLTGAIAYSQNELQRSDSLLQLALQMKEELYEAPHTEIAYTLNYLASLYQKLKDFERAKVYARASLTQRRATLGDSHVETLASQGNVARSFTGLKQYDSALFAYDTALAIAQRVFEDKNHYYYGSISASKAFVSRLAGQLTESRDQYLEAIDILEATLPPGGHPAQAGAFSGLGLTYHDLGEFQKAVNQFEKALEIRQRIYSSGHSGIADLQMNMAKSLIELNQKERARSLLEQARASMEVDREIYAEELVEIQELLAKIIPKTGATTGNTQ